MLSWISLKSGLDWLILGHLGETPNQGQGHAVGCDGIPPDIEAERGGDQQVETTLAYTECQGR